VLFRIDVVGDGDEVVLFAHRLAEHFEQRGLARADRAADAHPQRRQFLRADGRVGGMMRCVHDGSCYERKSREYCDSGRAERTPSCGAKVLMFSGDVANAWATAESIGSRSATMMRWPAS